MLKSNLPEFIRLPDGTLLYPVIGGCLKQQPFTTATSRDAIAAEAKRRKLKYRRVEVLSRNLRGKLDLHRQPYQPTKWIFVEVKELNQILTNMKQSNDSSLWQRNDIQYPRLIAEILASGALDDKLRTAICDSMDLQPNNLQDLLTRAQHDWTTIKKTLLLTKQPPATLCCPHCKYKGKRPTENGQGFRYLSDQTTWRQVSAFKDATLIVNSWSEVYDEDHETNERLECRSCLNEFPIPPGVETEFS